MLKWQYRTEVVNLFGQYRSKHEKLELESSKSERYEDTWTDINELGQEGWELSSTERYVHEGNGEYLVAFSRNRLTKLKLKPVRSLLASRHII